MNRLAVLVIAAAVLVWVGQWISLRVAGSATPPALPPRLRARVQWWAGHRAAVGIACATAVVGGLASGLLSG